MSRTTRKRPAKTSSRFDKPFPKQPTDPSPSTVHLFGSLQQSFIIVIKNKLKDLGKRDSSNCCACRLFISIVFFFLLLNFIYLQSNSFLSYISMVLFFNLHVVAYAEYQGIVIKFLKYNIKL